jgi:hypothetical protein
LLDNEIINLFYERSEQAIMELSNKYGSVCRKVAKNILNNDLDAEECVNDTFLGAWNTIPPQKPDPLLTYICRIVRIDIELHEVEYRRESEGQILRIFIDKDSGVDLDTCAKASRAVKSIIDEKDLYYDHMEISFLLRIWQYLLCLYCFLGSRMVARIYLSLVEGDLDLHPKTFLITFS